MYHSERISKLRALQRDYERLATLVRRMEANEDAPVANIEWDEVLKASYNQVIKHAESLRGDLKL